MFSGFETSFFFVAYKSIIKVYSMCIGIVDVPLSSLSESPQDVGQYQQYRF